MEKQEIIELLKSMMPEEAELEEKFTGGNIIKAIEFGMKKQQLAEREIYLKQIKKLEKELSEELMFGSDIYVDYPISE